MTKATRNKTLLYSLLWLIACALYCQSPAQVMGQRQPTSDKPWQELVSPEGHFRIMLPDTPSETFIPLTGQIFKEDVRIYSVKTPVAMYGVLFGELPQEAKDRETLRAAFDFGRDHALSQGKLRLVSEKDITTAGIPAREYVMEDGAFMAKYRVYYSKGRFYQVLFVSPTGSGTPALDQYYNGLAAKFFSSFKFVS